MSHDVQAHEGIAACENCATPLQGTYCYRCGQSSHNPLRNVAHAIEEVFESFWHLDGRVFRTLRELWSPGRLANNYLAGHRAPYVPPLRLFVVLSVITFFLAQFAVSFGTADKAEEAGETATVTVDKDGFSDAKTAAEVIEQRDDAIRGLLQGKQAVSGIPGAAFGFDRSIASMREMARKRIRELEPQHPELQLPIEQTGPKPEDVEKELSASERADEAANTGSIVAQDKKPAASSEKSDKVNLAKVGFVERWLKKKGERVEDNLERFSKDPELLKHAIMGSIPTALFFLVPVFAIFLKLAYLETGRYYLEHLVVALYSHAWLCLALLTMCALVGLDAWITPHASWFGVVAGILEFFVWWAMPIYLLIMQKRVYRQAWWLTILKYFVIGTVYLVLVGFGAAFVGITSLIS